MTKIAVMLGGNLPGTPSAFAAALEKFRAAGVTEMKCSKIYTSAAVDCVADTPDFLDMAISGFWADGAEDLLSLCQQIEREAGRPAIHSSRESRILDCDIIFFGSLEYALPQLTIPHPRARVRRFVLEPLAEIAPEMSFPDGVTVAAALAELSYG